LQAERHVAEGARHVVEQQRIAKLMRDGHDVQVFETALVWFKEMRAGPAPPCHGGVVTGRGVGRSPQRIFCLNYVALQVSGDAAY
jgi:hypothetical protein